MSKVNRRKEIKEKEELRVKFQLAMNKNNKMAMKWLNIESAEKALPKASNDSFFDLPIIPNGASLSNLTLMKSSKNIGDFVKGTEIKPDLKPQSKPQQSKPMTALLNKMRSQNRHKIEKSDNKSTYKRNSVAKPILKEVENDSDSDNENIKTRSVKKGHTSLFDKKKKGKPF